MFSFTYKGVSSENKLKVSKVTRSILPPSSVRLLELDGRAGALFVSRKHGVRTIEIEVSIISNTLRSDIRQIAGWLDAEKPEPILFSDEPHLLDYAILDGETDLDEVYKAGFGTLTFICPNPYSIGLEKTVPLPTTINMEGTAPSFPTVTATITEPVEAIVVSNGSKKVHVNSLFQPEDVVVIDCSKGKVTINNTVQMAAVTIDSVFWDLKPFTVNQITISEGFAATVTYNEMYK